MRTHEYLRSVADRIERGVAGGADVARLRTMADEYEETMRALVAEDFPSAEEFLDVLAEVEDLAVTTREEPHDA
jgi:hypothetical protein